MLNAEPAADAEGTLRQMRAAARSMWGAERAAVIDETLVRTARAVWLMSQLNFDPAAAPAFFLQDLATPDETAGEEARE